MPDTAAHHDLTIERTVPVPADRLFAGWTEPSLLMRWFTPAPWRTTDAEIDPRPGGIFRSVMEGPDGERNENAGCVLEVEPGRRFVWTSVFGPGFVPLEVPADGLAFTAIIEFEPVADGTHVRATARHGSAADAARHAAMGFEQGWGAALDQLVALVG